MKSLSYLAQSGPYRLEKPIVIQFPVIDICNSRCQMCKIWENKKSDDITPNDLLEGLSNPLFSEVRSVGLNGGEPTLRKDLAELTGVLFDRLPKLKNIALITNAYKYKEVITRIEEVGEVVRKNGGHLDVMVSLDGYGEVHDRVRGKPGNFERAQRVIDFIQSSDLVGTVRIGCTIIKENVYGLSDLFEYCQSKDLYIKYRLGIPHQRLYTKDLKEPYALDEAERYHVAEFLEGLIAHYEPDQNQNNFYRSLIGQIVHGNPRRAGCDWQHRGATITSKGELLYCAVESDVLGNIRNGDSEKAYFDNQDHLANIIETKCAGCNHDYVGLPAPQDYRRDVAHRILNKTGLRPVLKTVYHKSGFRSVRRQLTFKKRVDQLVAHATSSSGKQNTPPRVMICGWYGTETLGDKAILGGIASALESTKGKVDVTLVSLHPYVSRMTLAQMPELSGWHIVSPDDAAKMVSGMDLLAFGGGPIMAIDELAEMEALFSIAKQSGVHTLIAGCGVGPLGEAHLNEAIARILKLADRRIFRDEKSRKLASQLGVETADDLVAEDPAFTWLKSERADTASLAPPSDHKVLLLGLRDFPWQSYAKSLSTDQSLAAKSRFESEIVAALEELVARDPTVVIRPLPMCTNHFGDDDRWFYRRLLRGNTVLADRLDESLLGQELSPHEYVKAFRQAHVALTMRFHSVVFALGLGVPTVVIDYTLGEGKVKALADRFALPHQNLASLDREFIVNAILEQLAEPRPQAEDFEPDFASALSTSLTALQVSGIPE